jgi:hypothetical protein
VSLPSREDYDHAMQLNNTLLFEGDAINPVRYSRDAMQCVVVLRVLVFDLCYGKQSSGRLQSLPIPVHPRPSPATAAHRHNLAWSRQQVCPNASSQAC